MRRCETCGKNVETVDGARAARVERGRMAIERMLAAYGQAFPTLSRDLAQMLDDVTQGSRVSRGGSGHPDSLVLEIEERLDSRTLRRWRRWRQVARVLAAWIATEAPGDAT